jgi:hypothetical protein
MKIVQEIAMLNAEPSDCDSHNSVLSDVIPRQLRVVIGRVFFLLYMGGIASTRIFHE